MHQVLKRATGVTHPVKVTNRGRVTVNHLSGEMRIVCFLSCQQIDMMRASPMGKPRPFRRMTLLEHCTEHTASM
jgi:hypothetical protein